MNMRNLYRKAALLAATGLAATAMLSTSASAAETFNFVTGGSNVGGSSAGNVRTFTGSAGTQVEVSGYSVYFNSLATGYVGQYAPYGLGVTSDVQGDGLPNDDGHEIDNSGRTDILVLQFNKVVSVSDLGIHGIGFDTDLTWAVGTTGTPFGGTLSFANWTALDNAFGAFSTSTGNVSSSLVSRPVNGGALSGNLFYISASASSSDDHFKLNGLTVATAAVPEPATWGMMLGGLGIVGMAMRRRKTAVSFA
jgi:hypothetical protein